MKRQSAGKTDAGEKTPFSLGSLLQQYRLEVGATQGQLADQAKVAVRTLRTVEQDGRYSPRMPGRIVTGLNQLRRQNDLPPLSLRLHGQDVALDVQPQTWLEFPDREWLRRYHGPGAMLTADFHVVPFHGTRSLAELEKLVAWCEASGGPAVRIYKGEGGMGKTRMAVELCHRLRGRPEPGWMAGFAQTDVFPEGRDPWAEFSGSAQPLLVVVDYAGDEAKSRMVSQLLLHLEDCPASKLRLLFLERDDLWLDRLHEHPAAREILLGPLLSRSGTEEVHVVPPVATTSAERAASFQTAARAFAAKLGQRAPPTSNREWKGELYDRVLFIHMQALLSVCGTEVQGKSAILRHLLARERDYWRRRLHQLGLSAVLLPAIEEALCAISLRNGAADVDVARKILKEAPLFREQPAVVRLQILTLLRECYPQGSNGIGPLQPDLLRDYLTAKFA